MANLSAWLPKLCLERASWSRGSEWAYSPFHVTTSTGDWTVATNGRTLVAFAGFLPRYSLGPHRGQRIVANFLRPVTCWYETVPLSLLRRWCGPAEYVTECTCLEGCEQCDHERLIYPKPRPGILLGNVLDRELLARYVEELEEKVVRLALVDMNANLKPAVFEPDLPLARAQAPWRVVIMPMDLPHKDYTGERIGASEIDSSWLEWNAGTVVKLAAAIREEARFDDLPILADALEEAGCDNADILSHCRQPGEHVRGCWVLDLLLGKE